MISNENALSFAPNFNLWAPGAMFRPLSSITAKSAGSLCIAHNHGVFGATVSLTLLLLLLSAILPVAHADEMDGSQPVSTVIEDHQLSPSQNDFSIITLSPGDKISVSVSGLGGEEFSGVYEINLNTALEIPYLPPLSVDGLNAQQVEKKLTDTLLSEKILKNGLFRTSVQVLEYSAIKVTVSGAVFEPGQVVINDSSSTQASANELIPGDNPMDRLLTTAILAAGGVTPRADVSNIKLLRRGEEVIVNLSGLFTGEQVQDIPLIAGDRIFVPDLGYFQSYIVRPSPITPTEVPTYVSNVTKPRTGRATLETSDRIINVSLFYYGTRLTQAVIAAQCAGGTRWTNAGRKVLFVHTNVATGETTSMERSIQSLLKENNQHSRDMKNESIEGVDSNDLAQQDFNPYLMPRDGIICYDSRTVDIREFFISVGAVLLPVTLWQAIVR